MMSYAVMHVVNCKEINDVYANMTYCWTVDPCFITHFDDHMLHTYVKIKQYYKRLQLTMHLLLKTARDVSPVVLRCFQSNLYCASAKTAISDFRVKSLTSSLHSATAIS